MPRMHYEPPAAALAADTPMAEELVVLYAVLWEEVNQVRRAVGLRERTPDELGTIVQQMAHRLKTASLAQAPAGKGERVPTRLG